MGGFVDVPAATLRFTIAERLPRVIVTLPGHPESNGFAYSSDLFAEALTDHRFIATFVPVEDGTAVTVTAAVLHPDGSDPSAEEVETARQAATSWITGVVERNIRGGELPGNGAGLIQADNVFAQQHQLKAIADGLRRGRWWAAPNEEAAFDSYRWRTLQFAIDLDPPGSRDAALDRYLLADEFEDIPGWERGVERLLRDVMAMRDTQPLYGAEAGKKLGRLLATWGRPREAVEALLTALELTTLPDPRENWFNTEGVRIEILKRLSQLASAHRWWAPTIRHRVEALKLPEYGPEKLPQPVLGLFF